MIRFAVGSRRWVRRYRAGLTVGTAAVAVVAFAVLLLRGAEWLYGPGLHGLTPDQQVTAIDDVRGRLIQLGAGLLALGALVYTARTFRLSREGHVTDRYTKAIEQLGSERLDVRLGAIYALERIMIDSARDHPTIVEVLAAYAREHSPVVAPQDRDPDTEFAFRATDVQAAVTVLGRRPSGREERGRLDLRFTDLTRADLNHGHLVGADLTGARLPSADLTGANLNSAKLTGANLRGAYLTDAYLTSANLTSAKLISAKLAGAKLAGALLTGADLAGADLAGADLRHANLNLVTLAGANLFSANLAGAALAGANLASANLTEAILDGANLAGANLTDAVVPAGYVGSRPTDPSPDAS